MRRHVSNGVTCAGRTNPQGFHSPNASSSRSHSSTSKSRTSNWTTRIDAAGRPIGLGERPIEAGAARAPSLQIAATAPGIKADAAKGDEAKDARGPEDVARSVRAHRSAPTSRIQSSKRSRRSTAPPLSGWARPKEQGARTLRSARTTISKANAPGAPPASSRTAAMSSPSAARVCVVPPATPDRNIHRMSGMRESHKGTQLTIGGTSHRHSCQWIGWTTPTLWLQDATSSALGQATARGR